MPAGTRFWLWPNDIPEQTVELGEDRGNIAVIGWGSTYGPIHRAVSIKPEQELLCIANPSSPYLAAAAQSRHAAPALRQAVGAGNEQGPARRHLLRSEYLLDAKSFSKVTGKPFTVAELEERIAVPCSEAAHECASEN